MFIAVDQNNTVYREGSAGPEGKPFTWMSIPAEAKIVQLQLTYPFRIKLDAKGNQPARDFAPLMSIGKFSRYYFMNEATVRFIGGKAEQGLEAKIVGGIDDENKVVFEFRLDRLGNCSISHYPLAVLESKIENKKFNKNIIRQGA